MAYIFDTSNFIVESEERPLVSREEGGHVVISPKVRIEDRTLLAPTLATELMHLTIIVGEAMSIGLKNRGIDIGRINYQDNGNWSVFKPEGPFMHVHLYGRAKNSKVQKYGEACSFPFRETGFYDDFLPLNEMDIEEIQKQLGILLKSVKYAQSEWNL